MGRADNLTTFMCRLSWNLGASTSWNPQGLSMPLILPFCISTYSRKTHEFTRERSVLGASSERWPITVWWRNAGTADILIRWDDIVTRMELCKRCHNNQQLPCIALPQSFDLWRTLSILQDYDSISRHWILDRDPRCPEHVLLVPIRLRSNLWWCRNGQGLLEC